MFNLEVPAWELIIRAIVVYTFLLIGLRLTGKRQVGQLAPFDFILLLILSNAVQNSMNAGDNSLIGGLISATGLILINLLMGWATFRNRKIASFIEGEPSILIHRGKVNKKLMKKEMMSHEELQEALRRHDCFNFHEVEFAILETNGSISLKKFSKDSSKDSSPPPTADAGTGPQKN
jgi:uncharacterized membrane protein YcaP (DUF421 family)